MGSGAWRTVVWVVLCGVGCNPIEKQGWGPPEQLPVYCPRFGTHEGAGGDATTSSHGSEGGAGGGSGGGEVVTETPSKDAPGKASREGHDGDGDEEDEIGWVGESPNAGRMAVPPM